MSSQMTATADETRAFFLSVIAHRMLSPRHGLQKVSLCDDVFFKSTC